MAWYKSIKNLGKALVGSKNDAGLLGVGQYKAQQANIDESAFTDTRATNRRRREFADAIRTSRKRTGPTMTAQTMTAANIDRSGSSQWEGRQRTLADALQAQMEGRGGPSLAEMQMQRGLNQSLANANAQAASMRGINPAMALRQTQNNAAAMQQDTLTNQSMLRAQEQQTAREQFGNLSTQARGQSADMERAQAELQQQAAMQNQQAENTARANNQSSELQQRGLNDAQERFLREGQMTMDERDRQAKMDLGKLRVNENVGLNQINSGAYADTSKNRQGMLSGAASGIAAIFSDANKKTDIKPVSAPTEQGKMDVSVDGKKAETTEVKKPEIDYQPKDNAEAMGMNFVKAAHAITKAAQGAGASSAAAAASDKGSKKNIGNAGNEGKVKEFLDALSAYTYRYKEPEKNGAGEHLGVMAQDLEKSSIGKTMVHDTPEGKMVDFGKAGGALLASQAMINDRLSELEKAFSARKGVKYG